MASTFKSSATSRRRSFRSGKSPDPRSGNVLAAGNFGVLVGSLVFTMVADKIGRRPVLIGATMFFSALTLLTSRVTSVAELTLIRFVAGIGLGCIIPNATALIGEYSPARLRVAFMACISVGFTAGAAVAGFVSAWLIPAFGWRSVFYFGGLTPLVIAVLMFVWLPESLQFLVLKRRNLDKVGRWLRRIDPTAPIGAATQFVLHEESKAGVPAMHLFSEGRALDDDPAVGDQLHEHLQPVSVGGLAANRDHAVRLFGADRCLGRHSAAGRWDAWARSG